MSKSLLKEAIADAKAVRETAIANAKLALEEAFTPKLQSMLSAKISEEMDDEELEDEVSEMDHEEAEAEVEEGGYSEDMEGEEADEMDMDAEEVPAEEDEVTEMDYEEAEEEEEDLELEAIIRELEDEEEGIPAEDEEEEVAAEGKISEEDAVGDIAPEDEDEDIDLDEVIKSLSEEDEEEEVPAEEEELEEAYKTIRSLKDTLQEVNLLNAKLLFSNRLFKSNNLSESQKMKVIETFDRANNLREVKLVYSTLAESFTGRSIRTKVKEGFASKKSNSTAPKGRIVESNGMADRMKRLAGLL